MLAFAVLGNGAVGLALESLIAENSASVQILQRNTPLPEAEIYLVATKAYDVFSAVHSILHTSVRTKVIVLCCNGFVKNPFKNTEIPVILGSISFGSRIINGKAVITGIHSSALKIGAPDPNIKSLCAKLLDLNFCSWDDDIIQSLQLKWLYNTALNSFVAVSRLPRNGLVMDYEEELEKVFSEAFILGETVYGSFNLSYADLWDRFLELIAATSTNQNSMQKDIESRKHTEAEFFTGLSVGLDGFLRLKKLHSYLC